MATPNGENFLIVPGPSRVPDRVLRAMHRQNQDHRSADFPALTISVLADLKKIFLTTAGVPFVFMATGTGGWESAIANALSPGDKVLTCRYGQFSHLWIDLMQRFGVIPVIIDMDWGEGAPADKIEAALRADTKREYKAVCVVQNETTTGVFSDIPGVRAAIDNAKHPALFMVDGVSSIASLEFRFDDWGVDVAVTGSQKGFMMPAGLGFVCVSQKAIAASKTATLPRVFFSWADMLANNPDGYFPYTPSSQLLWGLREAMDMLLEEGMENVWARHNRMAHGVRLAVKAWGLTPVAKKASEYSGTVTTIRLPEGIDGAKFVLAAYQRYNLSLGGGLMKLKGKVFRIGTLGDVNELIMLGTLAGTEMNLRDFGHKFPPGAGVAAAAEYYRATATATRGLNAGQAKI